MMNEIVIMLLALLAGFVLGVVFFGGLWLTVKNGLQSKKSALVFTGSFIIRMVILLVSFYFIVQLGWENAVVCLAGFIIARFVVIRLTKQMDQTVVDYTKETQHET